ncbi:DUF389 domain-containing protein [Novosphingobium nitrogenifigens]|nr:DUF389 domain-containing protein [Novosphingobium nitrogenifigens]
MGQTLMTVSPNTGTTASPAPETFHYATRARLWWRRHVSGTVDHPAVMQRVADEAGWTPRFAFMVLMSAGIAELGLLQSSPAVVIGAMLISPLMGPIMGLGFGLALFDFASLRRSLVALGIAVPFAIAFTAAIVLLSPLKSATPEILARTQPNLFDLVVALFSALAGTFALIRGKGETIVGVAIATALMPPLATVGFGLATANTSIAGGAFALFATNFVTIALSATIMARLYGFGHALSSKQSWLQTGLLLAVFVVMAVPLGFALQRIAGEAVITSQVRSTLTETMGERARVTQLDIDFQATPLAIRTVVIAPRKQAVPTASLKAALAAHLGQPVEIEADQVLIDPASAKADEALAALTKTQDQQLATKLTGMVAVAAGVPADAILVDRSAHRIQAAGTPLPGATLSTYRALEERIAAQAQDWSIAIVPPAGIPLLPVPADIDETGALGPAALDAIRTNIWAAHRWNWTSIGVPGMTAAMPSRPTPEQIAAAAVAKAVADNGLQPRAVGPDLPGALDLIIPGAKKGR